MEPTDYAIDLSLRLGAKYADARVEDSLGETIAVKDGKVEKATSTCRSGLGVRVLLKNWGFASTTDLSRGSIRDTVRTAVKMARAKRGAKVTLSKSESVVASPEVRYRINPFDLSIEEKVELCLEADRKARVGSEVKRTSATIATERVRKLFVNSEQTRLESTNMLAYAEVFALAKRGAVTEYFNEIAGGTGGFEIVRDFDMLRWGEEVGKRASALVVAKTLPERKLRVVLDPDFVSLLCHEIIGHPSEADRVLGKETAWAGTTWWAGKLGERVGSELLNAVDDPRVQGALGYYEYDDEGTPAKRKQLIREGVLLEHMHSRETAAEFGVEPNGNMRAQSFEYLPLIRMSNTFIELGDFERDELFELKEGVYFRGAKIPSIDSRRYNFQLSAKEAFYIRHGELVGPFRDASLMGNTPEFFASIDAVAKDFEMRPIPNCGKGDPMQTLHMGNGGPHLRAAGWVVGAR